MWIEKLALEFLLESAGRGIAQVFACTHGSVSVPVLSVCTCACACACTVGVAVWSCAGSVLVGPRVCECGLGAYTRVRAGPPPPAQMSWLWV